MPASQSTASVAQFRCLFTHDVRRKQKRWQDGYLSFHSFNSRVMVYDQARNYLGDTYHKNSDELHEGDELSLDKGIMVEVAETLGFSQTDLAPLLQKKPKESPNLQSLLPPAQWRQISTPMATSNSPQVTSQLRHKSLNTLLSSSRGIIGRATPSRSPFEARKDKENEVAEEKPAKRQKTIAQSTSWKPPSIAREQTPLAQKDSPPSTNTSISNTSPKPARLLPLSTARAVTESGSIHTSVIHSDVTIPTAPSRALQSSNNAAVRPATSITYRAQAPRSHQRTVSLSRKKIVEAPKPPVPRSSPPVSVSNRVNNVDFAIQPGSGRREESSSIPSSRDRKIRSLRLPAGRKRAKLLCQSLPQDLNEGGESRNLSTQSRIKNHVPQTALSLATAHSDDSGSQQNACATAGGIDFSHDQRKRRKLDREPVPKKTGLSAPLSSAPLNALPDSEVAYSILNEQVLAPSKGIPRTNSAPHKRPVPDSMTSDVSISRPSSPTRTKRATQKLRSHEHVACDPLPLCETPSPGAIFQEHVLVNQNGSRAQSSASEIPLRRSATPVTKNAPSAGGFPKKRLTGTKQNTGAPTLVQAHRNETVPLPPHPFKADRRELPTTTTKSTHTLNRSERLQNASKNMSEDQASSSKCPQNRSFRRVRSENDAPIPSMAEEWEKKNLAETSVVLTEDPILPLCCESATESASALPTSTTTNKTSSLSALIKRTDPRRKFNRTQSLVTESKVTSTKDTDVLIPALDTDTGPWSAEAFDLLDWRPPVNESTSKDTTGGELAIVREEKC